MRQLFVRIIFPYCDLVSYISNHQQLANDPLAEELSLPKHFDLRSFVRFREKKQEWMIDEPVNVPKHLMNSH